MRRLKNVGCHIITSRYRVDEVLKYARMLDGLKYDVVAVGDHTLIPNSAAPYPNAQTMLSAIGATTERVRLTTAVTDSFRRHPVEIAQGIATIDQITRGRGMLGIGGGETMNLAPFGIEWSKPFTRLKEAIEVIRMLWSATPSSPADFDGTIFKLRGAYLQTRPYASMPPVYIGAIGKKTRELVGETADGWLPVAIESPVSLKHHLEDVVRGLDRSQRRLERLDVTATVYADLSEDENEALAAVGGAVRAQLVQERGVLELLTGLKVPEELSIQKLSAVDPTVQRSVEELAASIPEKVIKQVAITGSPDDSIRRMEQYLDAGVTSFLLCNLSRDQERTFETFATRVIPYLRENYAA